MSPDERPDAELLRAHVDGDPRAFGALVARHRDRLWAVALRTTGDREEAADALQDALVSAFRRAGSFRGDAAVTTWLHRIVVNAALDRLRRAGVRRTEALPDDLGDTPMPGHDDHGPSPDDPVRAALDGEVRDRVHAALRELPEDQRVCLVLVDLEEWPVAEVAERLGIPVGTVKSRCHRGRARLAGLLPDLRPMPHHDEAGERASDGTTPPVRASDSSTPLAAPPGRPQRSDPSGGGRP